MSEDKFSSIKKYKFKVVTLIMTLVKNFYKEIDRTHNDFTIFEFSEEVVLTHDDFNLEVIRTSYNLSL